MTGILFGSDGSGGGSPLPVLGNPAAANHILLGRQAIDGSGHRLVGTVGSKTAATYTPASSAQVIPAGQYLSGDQTIAAAPYFSQRTNCGGLTRISREVGFRPRRIAILLNAVRAAQDKAIICCRYDADREVNSSATLLYTDGTYPAATDSGLEWTISDTGFTVRSLLPEEARFDGTYYILAGL